MEYHDRYWKGELIDRIILIQDAFDKIDQATPIERQAYMLELVLSICRTEFEFDNYEEVQPYYSRIINTLKQMNYLAFNDPAFKERETQLNAIIDERKVN